MWGGVLYNDYDKSGEIAPPTLRGTLGTCTQFAMVTGILVSPLLSFSLATVELWRFLFALTPALALFQLVVSPFLLESPRWLLTKSENSTEARCVIKALRGFRMDEEVENEVTNFLYASAKHKTGRDSAHSSGAIMDLFKVKSIRILVISSIVLQMSQQLCGINAGEFIYISQQRNILDFVFVLCPLCPTLQHFLNSRCHH
jgi:MFS transporter, SP family, solute carrier family 2 (facilitated glucose transporter), member 3